YVKHERTYASLAKEDDVLSVGVERAQELLAQKKSRGRREPLRIVGTHPESGDPIELHEGRFGPYVKHGKTNASPRKDHTPEDVTIDQALELLAAREARKGKGGRRGKAATNGRKAGAKTTGKRATAKKAGTKTAGAKATSTAAKRPKATTEQLEAHL